MIPNELSIFLCITISTKENQTEPFQDLSDDTDADSSMSVSVGSVLCNKKLKHLSSCDLSGSNFISLLILCKVKFTCQPHVQEAAQSNTFTSCGCFIKPLGDFQVTTLPTAPMSTNTQRALRARCLTTERQMEKHREAAGERRRHDTPRKHNDKHEAATVKQSAYRFHSLWSQRCSASAHTA